LQHGRTVKWKLIHHSRLQPWGMFEFAVSDPDEHLVRIGFHRLDIASLGGGSRLMPARQSLRRRPGARNPA
jgi:hypothetical protein